MAAAKHEAPAPPELRLAWECERWNCLPETGAYLDQDYALMRKMTACSNIYGAYNRLQNAQGTQIHSLSENDRNILGMLVKMGLLFNADS